MSIGNIKVEGSGSGKAVSVAIDTADDLVYPLFVRPGENDHRLGHQARLAMKGMLSTTLLRKPHVSP